MIETDELISFKKMWTWLSGYPAHDREYYMKHVAKLGKPWINSCPLATAEGNECNGCRLLWYSKQGTLCTDVESPLYKWMNTSRQTPDDRSFYASHVAVLAMNTMRELAEEFESTSRSGNDYVHSMLHG